MEVVRRDLSTINGHLFTRLIERTRYGLTQTNNMKYLSMGYKTWKENKLISPITKDLLLGIREFQFFWKY